MELRARPLQRQPDITCLGKSSAAVSPSAHTAHQKDLMSMISRRSRLSGRHAQRQPPRHGRRNRKLEIMREEGAYETLEQRSDRSPAA